MSVVPKHSLSTVDKNFQVQPDETQLSRGRQTKTLSGGEKSFSTICLLLALWEAMGAPIRCLDELLVLSNTIKAFTDTLQRCFHGQC